MKLALNLDAIQSGSGVKNPPENVGSILSTMLPYLFSLAGILLLIYMITGGLQMMFAKGDPKAMQSAQGKITTALIGFFIVVLAYFITSLIGQIFGINIIQNIFGGTGGATTGPVHGY